MIFSLSLFYLIFPTLVSEQGSYTYVWYMKLVFPRLVLSEKTKDRCATYFSFKGHHLSLKKEIHVKKQNTILWLLWLKNSILKCWKSKLVSDKVAYEHMGTGFNFIWPEYEGQSQRSPPKDYYLEGRENLHPDSKWG